MNEKIYRGKVVRWDDQKGFGFIASEGGRAEIFLHISALKRAGQRPVVGDRVQFEIHQQDDDRKRAVNVRIDGATAPSASQPRRQRPYAAGGGKKDRKWIGHLALVVIVVVAGVWGYKRSPGQSAPPVVAAPPSMTAPVRAVTSRFRCAGKLYCSQMTSCAEATFYQRNCPGTKMDGDGDGIPCERQWCG